MLTLKLILIDPFNMMVMFLCTMMTHVPLYRCISGIVYIWQSLETAIVLRQQELALSVLHTSNLGVQTAEGTAAAAANSEQKACDKLLQEQGRLQEAKQIRQVLYTI